MCLRSKAILLGRRRRQAQLDEARDLVLDPQETVLEFQTLRLLDEQPISLITHCFAARHQEVLQSYVGGSMRQHLEGRNVRLKRVSTLIGARVPTQDRKSTRMTSSHQCASRMPSSA